MPEFITVVWNELLVYPLISLLVAPPSYAFKLDQHTEMTEARLKDKNYSEKSREIVSAQNRCSGARLRPMPRKAPGF